MTRQLFDDFIGTPPPTTVDLDLIIATQERSSARRRTTTILGAAVLSLGITAGVAALRPFETTPTPATSPPATTAPRDRTPAQWSAWLDDEVRAIEPEWRWTALPAGTVVGDSEVEPAGVAPRLRITGGGDGGAATGFIIAARPGVLEIEVDAGSATGEPVTAKNLCADDTACTTSSSGTEATCVVLAASTVSDSAGNSTFAVIRCAVPDHGPRVTLTVGTPRTAFPKDMPLPIERLLPLAARIAVDLAP